MNNYIRKIYSIMALLGNLLGLGGFAYAIYKNIMSNTGFMILIIILFVLLCAINIAMILKNKGHFESISMVDMLMSQGHHTIMLGTCILITVLMFLASSPLTDALVLIIIVMIFMSVMLMFMISIFRKLRNIAEESEKK